MQGVHAFSERWVRRTGVSPEAWLLVDAALGLVEPGPPALPAIARKGARLAADRGVTAIVQRVVGQVVAEDVAPQILFIPVGKRVDLPDAVGLVALELGRRRSG